MSFGILFHKLWLQEKSWMEQFKLFQFPIFYWIFWQGNNLSMTIQYFIECISIYGASRNTNRLFLSKKFLSILRLWTLCYLLYHQVDLVCIELETFDFHKNSNKFQKYFHMLTCSDIIDTTKWFSKYQRKNCQILCQYPIIGALKKLWVFATTKLFFV